jgi:HSP20 family protein
MLSRWDPFTELSRLQDEMVRAFGHEEPRSGAPLAFRPAVDIVEDKDAILLRAELPGLKAEDVHIELEKNVLTLRGERKQEQKVEKSNFYRFERRYGQFARSFVLPETVDGAAIEAELKDGVLNLRLPKKAADQPRKISVKAGITPKEAVGKA